ncbi:MAG: ATP-binding protein [Bacteroidales bacterium]
MNENEDPGLSTGYASPGRSDYSEIKEDLEIISGEKTLIDLMAAINGIAAIINENRQIVYANNEFIGALGFMTLEELLGRRPGEVVGCIHSFKGSGGCGTADACRVCGAVNAILESQRKDSKISNETRITTGVPGKFTSHDLKVTSSPVIIKQRKYYLFSVADISNEKRRQNLERIFFHDILNTAGNLSGLLNLLKEGLSYDESRKVIEMSEEATNELVEEIVHHRQILEAETGDLVVSIRKEPAGELLKAAVERMRLHNVAEEKTIILDDDSEDVFIETDRVLVNRILVNLLKNALEASGKDDVVFASVNIGKGFLLYSVRNNSVMTDDVKMQIFQRSFSTKGIGRGLGTYSIRMLTESYLKGRVYFTSEPGTGTVFKVELPLIFS